MRDTDWCLPTSKKTKSDTNLTICSYYITHVFQSESIPYSCLNVKELLAQNKHNLNFKWLQWEWNPQALSLLTNTHLAKLAKWLSCVVSNCLYGAFDFMFLSCNVCVLDKKQYSQMQLTDKYSQHSSIIHAVWLNGRVFVHKLSGCGFESYCSHWYISVSEIFRIKEYPNLFGCEHVTGKPVPN